MIISSQEVFAAVRMTLSAACAMVAACVGDESSSHVESPEAGSSRALGGSPLLHLQQVDVIPAPAGFRIDDIAISSEGTTLIRNETEGIRIRKPEDAMWSPHVGPLPYRVVGATFVNGGIEIVDAGLGMIYAMSLSGVVTDQVELCDAEQVVAAARASGGWYAILQDAVDDSVRYISYFEPKGSVTQCDERLPRLYTLDSGPVSLTAADADILITRIQPPFTTVRVSTDGSVGVQLRATSTDQMPSEANDEAVSLAGMPTLRLDVGYLQVLSEPATDVRHFILYSEQGEQVRRTTITGAIGFVSADASSEKLVGLRNIGEPEVVIYGWEWASVPTR